MNSATGGAGLADRLGLSGLSALHRNLAAAPLYEAALRRGEARLSDTGALVVDTGQHTGRSPKDKFIVREPATEDVVWWDNNAGIGRAAFETLKADMLAYAQGRELFVQDLFAGADPVHRTSRPRLHRTRLALAVHPQPAHPPRRRTTLPKASRA